MTETNTKVNKDAESIIRNLEGVAIFVLNPVNNQLLYANAIAERILANEEEVSNVCLKRALDGHAFTCFAYYNSNIGIPNLQKFEFDFNKSIANFKNSNGKGAVVLLNLKAFSSISLSYGYEQGNKLLRQIGDYFTNGLSVKKSAYHCSSDKFLFLLTDISEDDLNEFLLLLSSRFEEPWNVEGVFYSLSSDIAAIKIPEFGDNSSEIIQSLSIAILESKAATMPNYITFFNEEIKESVRQKSEIENELLNVIRNDCNEFEVYYQPVLDIKSGKWAGCEALLRWNSTKFGIVSPNFFLSVAESSGLIDSIGNFVLKESLSMKHSIAVPEDAEFHLSINLSSHQLHSPTLLKDFTHILGRADFTSEALVVEIGELSNTDKSNPLVVHNVNGLKALGARVALDDYNFDNSSMFDYNGQAGIIKLDKSIVAGIENDEFIQTFMKTISDVSGAMNLEICVKGIETESQYNAVLNYDCKYAQGYYFHKPMPKDDFLKLLYENI